jgi:hypothetical protein
MGLATAALCLFTVGIGALPASASLPPGSDPVVGEWSHWPYRVSCGGTPFDPASVFSGPAEAESGPLPSEAALRQVVADPALPWLGLSPTGWRLASESETAAVFITGQLAEGLQQVSLELANGNWKLAGNGTCTLTSALWGLPVVGWAVATEQPPLNEDTRRLRIIIGGGPCNSGMPFHPRKPIFRQLGKKLLMTIVIDPPAPGDHTCQGILQPPLTVKLPGRLGNRTLFDGATYPPRSAAETRGPGF